MKNTDYVLKVNSQGELTLPAELCQQYNLQPGTARHLVDLEGIFALVPFEPQVPALAQKIEQLCIESGIPFEELLQNLYTRRLFKAESSKLKVQSRTSESFLKFNHTVAGILKPIETHSPK